jgi:hypothetical protein
MSNTTEILSWIGNRIGKPPGWERVARMCFRRLELNETDGHVHAGYPREDHHALLLEYIIFRMERVVRIGRPGFYHTERFLCVISGHVADWLALPVLPFTLPNVRLMKIDPRVPICLYARAVKPANAT